MVNARAIGLVALLVLGLGSGIGGYFGSQYVDQQLQQGIEDAVKLPTQNGEGYDSFVSNVDADNPTFRKYYFWNLTNGDAFLAGAEPVYQEIGPYVYQEFEIKFNVQYSSDNSQVTYQTYKYYEFVASESFDGASVDDKIVNINPAYQGVIDAAGSEQNLVIGFVGPAMQSIVDGLVGDFTNGVVASGDAQAMAQIVAGLKGDFTSGVIYKGSAQALEGIENQAVENFEFAVNATTTANVINGTHGGVMDAFGVNLANHAYFNTSTFQDDYSTPIEGVSEWATGGLGDLGYRNTTITKLLYDGVLGYPGILADLATGTGVIAYLELYQNAITEMNGLDNATLQALYGATQIQLDAFAGYLSEYLIDDNAVIAGAYASQNGGQTTQEAAFTNLYSQWVNATFVPEGLDINDDGDDDGFELSIDTDYGINNATVTALFNSNNPLGLTNSDTGIFAWLGAAAGNTTLQSDLATAYPTINITEFVAIYTWLGEFVDFDTGLGAILTLNQIALTSNLSPGSVTSDNVGFLHWGSPNVTGGANLNDLGSNLPTSPEYWVYANESLSFDITEALFDHPLYNITSTQGVGLILQEGSKAVTGNTTALATLQAIYGSGLNATKVGLLLGYFNNVILQQFVLPQISLATGVANLNVTDLGYLHWGNPNVTGGETLLDLGADLPGSVAVWDNTPEELNLSDSKALLGAGPGLNLTTTEGVVTYLTLLSQLGSDPVTIAAQINAQFGTDMSITEIIEIGNYLTYIQQTFVIAGTLQPIFDQGGGLVTERSVNDWLFDAEDPLLAFLKANGQDIDSTNVGLFLNPDSQDDPRIPEASTIMTGIDNVENVGQYVEWQGNETITVWETDEPIEGTDASQFAPGVTSDEKLKAYVSDLLRVIEFEYSEDVSIKGIEALKYVIPQETLAIDTNYHQTIEGLANMSAAAGIQLFLSKPHFLDADSTLRDAVTGLSPNVDNHDTYLNVEPLTGAVIDARKRLQINLNVQAGNLFTAGVVNTMMPIVWVEDGGTIPDDSATSFKDTIYGAQEASYSIQIYSIIAGGILGTIAVFNLLRPRFT